MVKLTFEFEGDASAVAASFVGGHRLGCKVAILASDAASPKFRMDVRTPGTQAADGVEPVVQVYLDRAGASVAQFDCRLDKRDALEVPTPVEVVPTVAGADSARREQAALGHRKRQLPSSLSDELRRGCRDAKLFGRGKPFHSEGEHSRFGQQVTTPAAGSEKSTEVRHDNGAMEHAPMLMRLAQLSMRTAIKNSRGVFLGARSMGKEEIAGHMPVR